jgi:hypothetical protein
MGAVAKAAAAIALGSYCGRAEGMENCCARLENCCGTGGRCSCARCGGHLKLLEAGQEATARIKVRISPEDFFTCATSSSLAYQVSYMQTQLGMSKYIVSVLELLCSPGVWPKWLA